MLKYKWCALFCVMLAWMSAGVGQAEARSGRAAYHAHTPEMVTCARYEPHGSLLKVTNPETGRSIIVRVNGSGPYNGNRILDLSTGAFKALYGGLGRGVGPVQYTVVRRGWGEVLSSRKGGSRSKANRSRSKRRK
jgi:rare lipoprotein A